jgi:hypothetical protein
MNVALIGSKTYPHNNVLPIEWQLYNIDQDTYSDNIDVY